MLYPPEARYRRNDGASLKHTVSHGCRTDAAGA
jgi:hypothetical protein